MDKIKDIISPLSPAQLEELQRQHPDTAISTMSEEELKASTAILKQRREYESMFPILQPSNAADEINRYIREEKRRRDEFCNWLDSIALKDIICRWLTLEPSPENGAYYMTEFLKREIIHKAFADGQPFTVGGFRHIRHQAAIDYIKGLSDVSEDAKQEMIACYAAFVNYLNTITYGLFRRAASSVSTSYKMAPDAANQALSFSDWRTFIDALRHINSRDALIARLIIQGTIRITEALSLTIEQVDFMHNIIRFKQKGQDVPIAYDAGFIADLNAYVQETAKQRGNSPCIFITRNGKPLTRSRLNHSFAKASLKFDIKNVVTPESLRSTWVILKQQGWSDSAIMESKRTRYK